MLGSLGPMNWRRLRQEHRTPILHERLVQGRAVHREWIEESFAPFLPPPDPARERRILQLFAATDLYAWKLLRVDLGLPQTEVERLIRDTVVAIATKGEP